MTADAAERDYHVLLVLATAVDDALTRLVAATSDSSRGGPGQNPGDGDAVEERVTETLLAYLAATTPIQADLAMLRTAPTTAPDGSFMRVMAHLQAAFTHLGVDDGIDIAITELRAAQHLLTVFTDTPDDQVAG
ncbi:hypothetical protein LFM09_44875 [Lentzea alba]|uniref:hypothetical protein n=1 Tax=Lentzea alba TaxID=2714351 RepID=UPI0039BFBC28